MSDLKSSILVVTRTKSRPQLLMRAAASVCAQTSHDFTWVIVIDAGDKAAVERAADFAREQRVNTLVVHRGTSTGMEAASNAGIRAAASEFVTIHDDDDSWAPDFLLRTSRFLADHPEYSGVTTHCLRVEETIGGGLIREVRRSPHKPVLRYVQLADMLQRNLFPPISFLYRRDAFERIGGYDEGMAVLGDWDFNIRLLLQGDIGVWPEALANYHVRVGAVHSSADRNSITPGATAQQLADVAYRNRILRRDVADGRVSLGFLLAFSRPVPRSSFKSKLMAWLRKSE